LFTLYKVIQHQRVVKVGKHDRTVRVRDVPSSNLSTPTRVHMALIHEVRGEPKKQYMPYCSPHGFINLWIRDRKTEYLGNRPVK